MKILLYLVISIFSASTALAGTCDIPPQFANKVTVVLDTLSVSFATNKELYSSTETVQFYLVVTNIGEQTFHLNWGSDPQDGFFVLPDTCPGVDWPGCLDDPVFIFPQVIFYFSTGTTLEPGECRVWTESWDISVDNPVPPPDGTYNVFGGMCRVSFSSWIDAEYIVPADGVMLNLKIESTVTGVPDYTETWGRLKAIYRY
jgi:hypothetical protein